MGSAPNIGQFKHLPREDANPAAEVLGTIKPEITDPTPKGSSATWQSEAGPQITVEEPPPPWELEGPGEDVTDARTFVDVPNNWTLRWINPRLLDQFGWRYWEPVMASDPRVKVKVRTMVDVGNNIRRGGQSGDILAWMYTHWVESRRQKLAEKTAALTQSAVDRQQTLRDEFRSGKYGPYVQLTEAKHPTHTIGDGRTMRD